MRLVLLSSRSCLNYDSSPVEFEEYRKREVVDVKSASFGCDAASLKRFCRGAGRGHATVG